MGEDHEVMYAFGLAVEDIGGYAGSRIDGARGFETSVELDNLARNALGPAIDDEGGWKALEGLRPARRWLDETGSRGEVCRRPRGSRSGAWLV